jgi:hypothetical protein
MGKHRLLIQIACLRLKKALLGTQRRIWLLVMKENDICRLKRCLRDLKINDH